MRRVAIGSVGLAVTLGLSGCRSTVSNGTEPDTGSSGAHGRAGSGATAGARSEAGGSSASGGADAAGREAGGNAGTDDHPAGGNGGEPTDASAGQPAGGAAGAHADGDETAQAGGGASTEECTPPATRRNLFAELLDKSENEVDTKIERAFQALFHGSAPVYYESGDGAYILDTGANDVRSEGMSYGMMIAVQLDKQDEFDKLWSWAKNHMYHSSGDLEGLFAWQLATDGSVLGRYCAPDGDEYFATALIFASTRWGDGTGINAYSNEAKHLLNAMATKGVFDLEHDLVTFGPSGSSTTYTDASYILPAFYEVWSCFDSANADLWKQVTRSSRAFFHETVNTDTGLAPDQSEFDGSPMTLRPDFGFDAWRVVGNIMMDHNFFEADPWQETFAATYAGFWKSQGADYGCQYTLSGECTNGSHDLGLVAQNALVGFGVPPDTGRPFVQELWDAEVPTSTWRYYKGLLYMLALLHVGGRFNLWY